MEDQTLASMCMIMNLTLHNLHSAGNAFKASTNRRVLNSKVTAQTSK